MDSVLYGSCFCWDNKPNVSSVLSLGCDKTCPNRPPLIGSSSLYNLAVSIAKGVYGLCPIGVADGSNFFTRSALTFSKSLTLTTGSAVWSFCSCNAFLNALCSFTSSTNTFGFSCCASSNWFGVANNDWLGWLGWRLKNDGAKVGAIVTGGWVVEDFLELCRGGCLVLLFVLPTAPILTTTDCFCVCFCFVPLELSPRAADCFFVGPIFFLIEIFFWLSFKLTSLLS